MISLSLAECSRFHVISSFAERPGFQQLPGAFLYLPIAVDLSHGLHITLSEEVTDAIDTMTGRNLLDQTSLPDLEPLGTINDMRAYISVHMWQLGQVWVNILLVIAVHVRR